VLRRAGAAAGDDGDDDDDDDGDDDDGDDDDNDGDDDDDDDHRHIIIIIIIIIIITIIIINVVTIIIVITMVMIIIVSHGDASLLEEHASGSWSAEPRPFTAITPVDVHNDFGGVMTTWALAELSPSLTTDEGRGCLRAGSRVVRRYPASGICGHHRCQAITRSQPGKLGQLPD
jgi:hypothetical protein